MKIRRLVSVFAIALLFGGFVFAFLPHTSHAELGLEESHLMHTVWGMGAVLAALLLLVWSNGVRIGFRKELQ